MRPAVGARIPAITFRSVVLPDPFGPKMPTISPDAIENETSDTALSPPKRLVSSTASSSTAKARERADQPLRHDQNRQDQHQAVKDGPGLARELDHVRKACEYEGARYRPDD